MYSARISPPNAHFAWGVELCLSRGSANLFANDPAKGLFKRLLSTAYVFAKCFIDESLIVSASTALDLLPKPRENFLVEANGDTTFSARDGNSVSSLRIPEIIFTLHRVPHIAAFPVLLQFWPKLFVHCLRDRYRSRRASDPTNPFRA